MYKDGQRILERQRFQFPTSWLYVENLEGEWGAFNEIIKRKDSTIQTQVCTLLLFVSIIVSVTQILFNLGCKSATKDRVGR